MKIKLVYIIIGLIILGIVIYLLNRKSQVKISSAKTKTSSAKKKAGKIITGLNTDSTSAIAKVYSGT